MSPLARRVRPSRLGPASAVSAGAGAGRPGVVCTLLLIAVAGCGSLAGCGSPASHPASSSDPANSQHYASSSRPASSSHYGGYPAFLPRDTLNYHGDTVLTGTALRPALTNEGDGVEVRTAHWSVLVTVTGPEVPGEGLPYQAPATTCTWVVTMSGATGPVPVSASDFTSIDDANHVYRPAFVPGQPRPPKILRPGGTVSFELRAVQAVGEGLMRWAPDGRNIVAKWDFVVEND